MNCDYIFFFFLIKSKPQTLGQSNKDSPKCVSCAYTQRVLEEKLNHVLFKGLMETRVAPSSRGMLPLTAQ